MKRRAVNAWLVVGAISTDMGQGRLGISDTFGSRSRLDWGCVRPMLASAGMDLN